MTDDRIYLYDSTLRDGAQTQGVDFGAADKLAIAVAKSGTDAMTILGYPTSKFDLVISDWEMPEMTGLNLLKRVRETWPDMPFIMLTGKTSGDFVLAARDHGVNGYIAKPFAPNQLIAKIASVLRIKM